MIVVFSRKIFFDLDVRKDACLVNGTASPVCVADGETLS